MTAFERTDVIDEYCEGAESVVMVPGGRVYALSALSTAVLTALSDGPRTADELGRLLLDRFGEPATGEPIGDAVERIVSTLSGAGLLRVAAG